MSASAAGPSPLRPRKSRVGLRARVTIAFALGALVLSAVLAILTYELARTYLLRQRETSVLRQTYANARLVKNSLRSPDPDIPRLLTSVELPAGSSPVLFSEGAWFGASVAAGTDALPQKLRETVLNGTAARQRFYLQGDPELAVGVPLPAVRSAYFEVFSLAELDRTLRILRNSLGAAAAATAVAGAIGGRWASRRLLAPIGGVTAAAAAVAGGRLDVRLDEQADPDLSSVSISFNRMTDALQARIERDARFASDVSHELRSPLTTLAAAVEVLGARRDEMPSRAREALDLLSAEVAQFERLVEDLLEISRLDAGVEQLSAEDVVLSEFVLQAAKSGRAGLVPVEIDAAAAGLVVRADKRRLERVLTNLLENARRHGGGVLRVCVEHVDGKARFAVEDAGPGIPPDERDHVFQRFARLGSGGRREDAGGTGLGLSLAREHVRLHGGTVWCETRPGGGARFVVELPTAQ